MAMNGNVVLYPGTGHLSAPDDVFVSPGVRVAFARVSGVSGAYSDDNAVLMRFVNDDDPSASDAVAVAVAAAVGIRLEVYRDETWTEVPPWAPAEYMIMLGFLYRVSNGSKPLFELQPPHPRRELIHIGARHATSYHPKLHRMLLGEE